jgi:hypothetical protein
VALLLCAASNTLAAQTVRGVVVDDSSKAPLRDAVVTLLNTRGAEIGKPPVRSDSLGRFTLHAGDMGRYRVRVTRIGYQPLTSENLVFSFGGHVQNLTLAITSAPAKLGTVVVTGTTRLTNNELMSHVGYDLRKSKGEGKFIDSAELARYGREPAAWVLENNRGLYGIEFVAGGGGADVIRMMRGRGFCAPEIWIDGFQTTRNTEVLRLSGIGADQVYGIEVYSGFQLPPPSLGAWIGGDQQGTRPSQRCGALAVWTKAYVKDMQARIDAANAKKVPPPR